MTMPHDKLTIDERLQHLGYSHRRTSNTPKNYRHEILDGSGAVIGEYDAHGACQLLIELERNRLHSGDVNTTLRG